jgi:glycosyltransferase involved in cell wall biosynthesis
MKILFVDLTTGLESFQDLKIRARGGMVSSLYLLPKVLSKLNNECHIFSDAAIGGTTEAGVVWLTRMDENIIAKEKYDFLVLNRQTYTNGFPEITAKHRIFWVHDMVHGGWINDPEYAKSLAATVFMSEYSVDTWKYYYKDIDRYFIIPNGVDKSIFKPGKKDLNKLIFFSAPNRGLEFLPLILNPVREATGRDLKLTAFSNMTVLHPQETKERDKFAQMYEKVKSEGIDLRDPIPQEELAQFVAEAGLMLKPNNYAETCSNTTLQSLACGTPVITTAIGADQEWVQNGINGMISKYTYANDGPIFLLEMIRMVIDVLKNKENHQKMIKAAPKTKNVLTWEEVGDQWNKMLEVVY